METCSYCNRVFKCLGQHISRCPERLDHLRRTWIETGKKLAKQETTNIYVQNNVINNVTVYQNTLAVISQIDERVESFFHRVLPGIRNASAKGLSGLEIKQQLTQAVQEQGDEYDKSILLALDRPREQRDIDLQVTEDSDKRQIAEHLHQRLDQLTTKLNQAIV